MLSKGLVKAKSLVMPRTQAMDLGICLAATWERMWKCCGKLLAKSSKSKRFHKCSKTIPENPPIEKCNN
jgi:hypothetical protein